MKNATARKTYTCSKCEGTGWLTYHLGVANGRCFQCDGTGRCSHRVAIRPYRDADSLYLGDGTTCAIMLEWADRPRAEQLAYLGRALAHESPVMVDVTARLALLGDELAARRARAYFAGREEEFDAALSAFRKALA